MFKVTAIGHDDEPMILSRTHRRERDGDGQITFHDVFEEKAEMEYPTEEGAIALAMQLSVGAGIKSVLVSDAEGRRIWPAAEPAQPQLEESAPAEMQSQPERQPTPYFDPTNSQRDG